MFNEKNCARIFLGGLITGGILGGIAGLLFAPKSGKKLRRDISKKTDEIIDEAKHTDGKCGGNCFRYYFRCKEKS